MFLSYLATPHIATIVRKNHEEAGWLPFQLDKGVSGEWDAKTVVLCSIFSLHSGWGSSLGSEFVSTYSALSKRRTLLVLRSSSTRICGSPPGLLNTLLYCECRRDAYSFADTPDGRFRICALHTHQSGLNNTGWNVLFCSLQRICHVLV